MSKKQIIGILILLLGVILLAYAFHSKGRVEDARESLNTLTSPFSNRREGRFIKRSANSKLSHYDMQIRWLFIGGTVLVVIGGTMTYMHRRR